MEVLRKETGIIELTVQGDCLGRQTKMETDYNYELVVDPLLNKPAFVLNAETRIIFAPQDHILFRSYVIYIFDPAQGGDTLKGTALKAAARDGRHSMNTLLHNQLTPLQIAPPPDLPTPDEASEQEALDTLLTAGMRLN